MKRLQARMSEARSRVVTGGAGFIGSHMVDLLLDARLSRAGDRQSCRWPRGQSRAARATDPELDAVEWRDIRALDADDALFEDADSSFISPASATSCPRSSGRSITWTSTSRVRCACSNARALRESRSLSMRRRRLATAWPQVRRDEDHPIAPQHPYALSKYLGEHGGACTGTRSIGCRSNSIRIFNAYGPRVRTTGAYGAVFGVFFKQKLAGKPFTVIGDGTQTARFSLRDRCCRGVSARG